MMNVNHRKSSKGLIRKILERMTSYGVICCKLVLHVDHSIWSRVGPTEALAALRRPAAYFIIVGIVIQSAFGQSPNTTVSDTIASHQSGTAVISWTRALNDANPRQVIYPGNQTITITNGVINVSLYPTTVQYPAQCYVIQYRLAGVTSTRYWNIPVSATPVTLNQIEGQLPCPTQTGPLVSPAQINPGPAGQTTVLVSQPNGFVNWAADPGGGGGGSTAFSGITTGTNNTAQTMTVGSTSSLTFSGSGIVNANQILGTAITSLFGNSGKLTQGSGTFTNGDLSSFDSNGNVIDSTIPAVNAIVSTGSYANPAWITGLAASKLTGAAGLPCAVLPSFAGDLSSAGSTCSVTVASTGGVAFAPSATTDTTNAANISSGTIGAARLPAINLAASGAGGVTGNLPVTALNGGLNANSTTVWCGNGTWCPATAGGTVTHTFGALTAGQVVVGNNGADIATIPFGTTTTFLQGNPTGSPTWAQVNLTNSVTGILPGANGGTGIAFVQFAGPTALRTYTGPDASTTLLTTNAAVTLAQGGTGANLSAIALGGLITGTGAGTVGITALGSTNGYVLTVNTGAAGGVSWNPPSAGGTVTSIVFSAPLTGGTITATGTVGCATCTTSAAAMTNNQIALGAGSQGLQALGSLGTATTVLHGNSGGPPSFGAVVLTTDVSGNLPLANGGLAASLTASNGGIFYSTASAGAVLAGTATANQVPLSGANAAPMWSTATYPATTTANQLLYSSATNTIAGLATANNAVLVTNGSGVPSLSTSNLPFANVFPAGSQIQRLIIKPNTGNNTTIAWDSAPYFNASDYNFPSQAPGGTLTASTLATVTLTPCPLGVAASDVGHYLYVSGGTGTAEAVLISSGGSCTSGASSGTVKFTPANSHSGAWTIQSATAGITEAMNAAAGATVRVTAGTYALYGPIYSCQGTLKGDGMFNTILQIQTASGGAIDAPCQKDTFEDFGINILSLTPGTSGNYGIRLGNGTGHDNSFTRINRIYFEPLYDAVLCINCSQTEITNNVFYNFYHTAVTANDTTNPDNDGPWVRGNVMFNFNSYTTPALACVYATSTGGITITDNNCYGSNAIGASAQLQYNVYVNQTASTQVTIKGNVFETASVDNVVVTGVFNLITITGNTIAQPGVAQNLWRGIEISGNNTTSSCGTGIGICSVAISGNTIQGPGSSSTSSVGINIEGNTTQAMVSGNAINYTQIGINIGSSVTNTTIGQNQMQTSSFNLSGGSSTTQWSLSADTSWTNRPTAANGSILHMTSVNSTCTSTGSVDQFCKFLNGAWTN